MKERQEEEIKMNVEVSEAWVRAWKAHAGISRFLCPGRKHWTKDAWIAAEIDSLLRKRKTPLECRPEPRRFGSPVTLGQRSVNPLWVVLAHSQASGFSPALSLMLACGCLYVLSSTC